MKLTSKQIEFCKQVSLGKNATEAYRIAYNSKSEGTCKVNASKMLKQPLIKEKIKEFQDLNKKITEKATEKAIEKLADGEISDKIERQIILSKIVRGEVKIPNTKFFFDSKTGQVVSQEIEELPDHSARIKAIAELNKMDGSYAPSKQEISISEIPEIIVPGDEKADN